VKDWVAIKNAWRASVSGAALAVLAGLLLWSPLGEGWSHASYDYLFRFGSRAVTNQVTLILMDNGAFDSLGQTRGKPWDRALHTRLLNRLADDGCSLVVFDSLFHELRDPATDDALAAAMRRQKHIALMASQTQLDDPALTGVRPVWPADKFLAACGTNSGVAWLNPDLDHVVREQWPFPSPGPYPSLPWVVARMAGARLSDAPVERWLRYYGANGAWNRMSYEFALAKPPNYFRNQIVFIGNWPETSLPDNENDKFSTPYTRWTNEASGGVDILLASFLNLLNDESLLRPPPWAEFILFAVSGIALGGGFCRLRFGPAAAGAAILALAVSLGAISLSYFTNYWFPWLVIVGGQIPCALGWAAAVQIARGRSVAATAAATAAATEPAPAIPGYELVHPPFGRGSYGKVWLAKSRAGQWRAVKVVYLAGFENDAGPYEREFNGVRQYQPISDKHDGLLRVDHVSEKGADYFYYVMELGDALEPGWEKNPSTYKPRDLVNDRARLHKRRLPVRDCLRVGITLSKALHFLHQQGLTHRDIKPQNIIFVNGQPKLADLGLIKGLRPVGDTDGTLVGTPGYMPPTPERPGTVAADIYALGMVLYVSSTGRAPMLYPEVATTLANPDQPADFWPLNEVILKACHPEPDQRYASAEEMGNALEAAGKSLTDNGAE
jgi:CHASE2 domain-containing sensor protein